MQPSAARPWLMAEIGVNHDGDPSRAREMIWQAAAAGFDAVKFQYWIVDELLADAVPTAPYQGSGDQRGLLESLSLRIEDLSALREEAGAAGASFVCTPDGARACTEVIALEPDVLKIGSGDADNPWLLESAVASGLPLIVSTGMMDERELEQLTPRLAPAPDCWILHCISAYPTPLPAANLNRMAVLAAVTGRPVGFSDHTVGVAAAAAAVALGAVVIEKHVTWSTSARGPDHAASLPLDTAADWVTAVREVGLAVHSSELSSDEAANRAVVRKALHAARDLQAGSVLGADDLVPLRPLDGGIPAGRRDDVVGRSLRHPVAARAMLGWDDLST